jgi:hypothetical protein
MFSARSGLTKVSVPELPNDGLTRGRAGKTLDLSEKADAAMKKDIQLALNLLGSAACLITLISIASLLMEAGTGERSDFGRWGVLMLVALVIGQSRALWVLASGCRSTARRSLIDTQKDPAGTREWENRG